jgi:nucleoid DNA-binding protein
MAPAMKAMKAMKARAMKSGVLTQTQVISSVAETNGLKGKQVKGVIEALFAVACAEIKKNGNFKLAGMLNLKLKKKPATPAKKGVNPFTKEPCVFKAKPASKTVRALARKKLKEALN